MSLSVINAIVSLSTVFLIICIYKPLILLRWFLILRPCITPFAFWQYRIAGIPIGTPYTVALTLGGIASIFGQNKKIIPGSLIWLYLYFILSIPSLIIAPSVVEGLNTQSRIIAGIASYLIAYNNIHSAKDLRYLLISITVLSAVIPLSYGLYQFLTATANIFGAPWYNPRRITSVFTMANAFGEYLNIIILLLLGMLMSKHYKKWRKWLILLLAITAAESIMALNRGAWIALVVATVSTMLIYRKTFPIRWFVLSGLVIALTAGPLIVARFQALSQLSQAGLSQDTLSGRLEFAGHLLDLTMESPFVGKGLGFILEKFTHDGAPHNDFAWISVESGILALVMFSFFHITNVLLHLKNRRSQNWRWIQFSLCAIAIYYSIHSVFQNIFYNLSVFPFFMACFGASTKLMKLAEEEPAQSKDK